jgi:hypothetical protein
MSTAIGRWRPFSFLAASQPPPPGAAGALTVWRSITPAVGLACRPALAVQHEGDIVQGLEQQAPRKAPEPPIHRLPRPNSCASRSRSGRDGGCVEDLAQVGLWLASAPGRL